MHFTRRQFLQKLAAGSALVAFPSLSGFSRILSLDDTRKLGIALVGLGGYASERLAPALKETTRCYLAGVVTGTPQKAEQWKKQYALPERNVYSYDTFDQIADNPSIDVVYIVLPNSMHHDFVLRAAAAGKHVICEKPMALSVKECREMIAACKAAGVRLFVGYRLHFDPYHRAARQFRKTDVGAITKVEAELAFTIGDPSQWRLRESLAGGGAMMDLGIYLIQAARYATGEEPVTVTATEEKTDPVKFKDVDETVRWQMDFPGGAVAHCVASYTQSLDRLHIEAERGWFELQPAFGYAPIKGRTHEGELHLPLVNQQAAQMDEFARCIIEGAESDAEGEEGLRDIKVIEAIYKSIASKTTVEV
jgi:predicted dehydrogenase